MFQRTFLAGFALVLLAAQACGSDDGKKNARNAGDAGMGGEAGQPGDPAAGGSSAGEAPLPVAGMSGTETGGVGGQPQVDPTGGAGGEAVVLPPDPEILFSVKPGAVGLDETGIREEPDVQNVIYSSKTGRQEAVEGTNAVKITGESLGLAATDQIVAFAIAQPTPQSPHYLFSLADAASGFSAGSDTTRADASYYADGGAEEGDIYYSDGVQSFRDVGDGDEYGYNAMLATELSLGLDPGNNDDRAPDDLTGLAIHDANRAITELYFTVSSVSTGADDTALAGIDPTERACTVFKSALSGNNSVAFSCADLGLLPSAANPDQLDALAIYGTAKPTKVLFSVTSGSQGAVGSAVESVRLSAAGVGSTLFESAGTGQNAVLRAPSDLGLTETAESELDGLAVVDRANGKASNASSCNLAYAPLVEDTGGGLTEVSGVSHIGDDVLVVSGYVIDEGARLIAYDAKTCAFLKQVDLPLMFSYTTETAIVPLAGWTQANPFEKVEYLRVEDSGSSKALVRYDASGTFVQTFPVFGTEAYYDSSEALVYEPSNDRLYLLLNQPYANFNRTIRVFPRPDETVTSIDVPMHYRTHPCGNEHELIGTDPAGNLKIGTLPGEGDDYRVCTFTPGGELLPAPYFWTTDEVGSQEGYFAADGSHYLLHQDPFSIERGTYSAP